MAFSLTRAGICAFSLAVLLMVESGNADAIKVKAVEVQGIQAIPYQANESIALPNGGSGFQCLQSCTTEIGCLFVTFDNTTGTCLGFRSPLTPWLITNALHSLWSSGRRKLFRRMNETEYDTGRLVLNTNNHPMVRSIWDDNYIEPSYGIKVASQEVCTDLCRIIGSCNAVTYTVTDDVCYLKKLREGENTPQNINVHNKISYVQVGFE